jgi:hypothetical protein
MTETQELILNSIGVLCREYPQQRLGQIIYNYILTHCPNADPFYIEDEKLLEILEQELEKISH